MSATVLLPLAWLRDAGAREDQLAEVARRYPAGVPINQRAMHALAGAGVDVWFAAQLLTGDRVAEYQRVSGPALAEYKRVCGPALLAALRAEVRHRAACRATEGR